MYNLILQTSTQPLVCTSAFAKKEHTAQLNDLRSEERLQRTMEVGNWDGIDAVFPFDPAFVAKIPDCVERCDQTRMNVLYTEMVTEVLFDHRGRSWVKGELVRSRSEI